MKVVKINSECQDPIISVWFECKDEGMITSA